MNRFISLTGLKWRDSVASHLSVTAVFLALVTALAAQQPPEFQSAQWTRGPLGNANLTIGQNGALTKSAGGSTLWNAGAVAGNRILRDGGVSFKGLAGGASQFAVGLNLVDSNELNSDIDHAIWLLSNNTAQVYHGATAGVLLGSFTNQTEFTIRRVGAKLLFFKDNNLMHTSTTASVGIMSVDCSFYKQGSQMTSCLVATGDLDNDGMPDAWEEKQLPAAHSWNDVVAFLRIGDADQDGTSNFEEYESTTSASDSFSRTEPVVWSRDGAYQLNSELTTDKGGIKKQTPGTTAAYNSRAFASKYIKEDGLLVFRLTPGAIATVGLNTSDVMPAASSVTPDVEWAIITAADGTYTIKPNAAAPTLASPVNSYTAETIFAIQRKAGQVQFLKDGVVIHTASAWSSEPLYPNVWLSSPGAQLTLARLDTGDMDEDGLPDIWERSYLPPDSGWKGVLGIEPYANADVYNGDGQGINAYDNVTNWYEFISGTSPIDPLSRADEVQWRQDALNAIPIDRSFNGGLTKTSTSTTYNARALGTKGILEDGLVAFQVSASGIMTFGLNTSNVMPPATSVTPDVPWAFVTTAAGTYTIKANPTIITPAAGLGAYTSKSRFVIQRVGGVVRFLKDGVLVHTAAVKSSGPLYVNAWLNSPAMSINLARCYTGDIDEDGLPDAWELSYLPANAGYSLLDAFAATGPAADPDMDGVQNLDEYYDGTNPYRALLKPVSISWQPNPASYFNLSNALGGIKKTSTVAGWNADAVASKLDSNNQWVPLSIGQTGRLCFTAGPASSLAMGFTVNNGNRTQNDLEYMIQLTQAGQASVYEGTGGTTTAVLKAALGAYDAGTRFSIRRVAQRIEYLKDGQVCYSSTMPVYLPLYVDSSFNTTNSEIIAARVYTGDVDEDGMPDDWEMDQYQRLNHGSLPTFAQLQAFAANGDADSDGFTNLLEYCHGSDPLQKVSLPTSINWNALTATAAIAGGRGGLTKTGTTAGYNADATSTETLAGDGVFSFSAAPGILAAGLTYADNNNADTDLEFAFVLSATDAAVKRPDSTTNLSIGAYNAGTVFAIRRAAGVIEFLKDGVVVETSSTPSAGALYADCSLSGLGTQISSAYINDGDIDNDGLPDWWELQVLTANQSTWQSITLAELQNFTPESYGPDNDGVSNLEEYLNGTSAVLSDTDGDGMSDRWEIDLGLAADDASNATADLDSDGLNNLEEFRNNTNPRTPDTDVDGMGDLYEVKNRLNPLVDDSLEDADGDQVPNLWECSRSTYAMNAASKPAWDAIVDLNLGNAKTNDNIYASLSEAYNSISPYRRSLILMRRGVHQGIGGLDINGGSFPKKVAIVGERGIGHQTPVEGAVLVAHGLDFYEDVVLDSLILESGGGLGASSIKLHSNNNSPRARFVNCLFRNNHHQEDWVWDELLAEWVPPPAFGGTITNFGARLTMVHCTVYNCTSYYMDELDKRVPISSISTTDTANTCIRNSIVWEDGADYVTPKAVRKGEYGTEWAIFESVVQSSPQNPNLQARGYMTSASTAARAIETGHLIGFDLKGQKRSTSRPTVGAVEWINDDGDHVPDWWEIWWFSNTGHADADTTNPLAVLDYGSAPLFKQTLQNLLGHYLAFTVPTTSQDGDHLQDTWELLYFGNLGQTDTLNPDSDGRTNIEEQSEGTDPTRVDRDFDSDGDGLPDSWEIQNWGSILPSSDGKQGTREGDPDADGWTNLEEYVNQTNPNHPDTAKDGDSDGMPDAWEKQVFGNTNIWDADDDADGDGVSNLNEYLAGTDPTRKPYLLDQNHNGLWDGWELRYFGSVSDDHLASNDTDQDGYTDGREMLEGTDPLNPPSAGTVPNGAGNFSFSLNVPTVVHHDDPYQESRTSILENNIYQGVGGPLLVNELNNPGFGRWNWADGVATFESGWRTGMVDIGLGYEGRDPYLYERYGWPNSTPYTLTFKGTQKADVRLKLNEVADRLFVRRYRKKSEMDKFGGLASIYTFVIRPGQLYSDGLPVRLNVPDELRLDNTGDLMDHLTGIDYLIPAEFPIPRTMPAQDVAGPRYRKIGLNGVPMPDSLPGEQNEGSALPEETFVDAYSRQLRHSTSDVWTTAPSTDLPLQVRRDLAPEAWSWRSGLRPDERPDRPFGPCWTSNLTPHLKLEISENRDEAFVRSLENGLVSNDELFEIKLRSPPRISITDERGASYSFVELSYPGYPLKWVPAPDERSDAKTAFDTLTQQENTPLARVTTFTLRKRNGTVCTFTKTNLQQTMPQDRAFPETQASVITYFRMTGVVTAQQNKLVYHYGGPENTGLIPVTISDPDRTNATDPTDKDFTLTITQDNGRITSITGPSGETIHYHYSTPLEHEDPLTPDSKIRAESSLHAGLRYPLLTKITREDSSTTPPTVLQQVSYEYSYGFESDPTPDPTRRGHDTYGHLELSAMVDEPSKRYDFEYRLNQDARYEFDYGATDAFTNANILRRQTGIPRLLTRITRPDHSMVNFLDQDLNKDGQDDLRNVQLAINRTVTGGISTRVSGPCGDYTYSFHEPHTYQPYHQVATNLPMTEGVVFLSFTRMDIHSAAGTEFYTFNPAAGMALSSVQDLSGNTTSYEYADAVYADAATTIHPLRALDVQFYDDPTAEISAIHGTPRDPRAGGGTFNGRKTFTYDAVFRSLTSMTDEAGIKTINTLNSLGLREREEVFDTLNTPAETDDILLRRTVLAYVHPTQPAAPQFAKFKAFLYRQTITADGFQLPAGYAFPAGYSSPAMPVITDYIPDANGRVKDQIQYADAAQTLPLITSHTYTGGGSKQTLTDPRGKITFFEYWPQTLRLKATHFQDDATTTLDYDAHGNLTREVDALGTATFHEYDELNRRIRTTIDLNGNGAPDDGYTTMTLSAPGSLDAPAYNGDLVTTTAYNAFNLPVAVTDPRGIITRHEYDAIGRPVRAIVNAEDPDSSKRQVTLFTNGNSIITDDYVGGSIFNMSGFKPLQVTDPRGFVTTFTYDKLYRQTSKTLTDTSYSPAMLVRTETLYDDAGNATHQYDPLNRLTRTEFDALGRPVRIHFPQAADTPASSTQSFHTSSGLVWRTLDEVGAETLISYDAAGRRVRTLAAPILDQTSGLMVRPESTITYDNAGNVIRVLDPLGHSTVTEYDDRNRPKKVTFPAVLNALTGLMEQPTTLTYYDLAGRTVKVTDPLGNSSETRFDRAGRAYRTIAPQTGTQTHVASNRLDPDGNILEAINAGNQSVTNVYDGLNRLIITTDHSGISNRFDYDPAGNRVSVKDGLSRETVFTYDAQNRLLTQTFANANTFVNFYNAVQKISQRDAKTITTTYAYDARDRLVSITAPDLQRQQGHDPVGRVTDVSETGRPQANVLQTYDALGWLRTESPQQGITHTYGYDRAGNRVSAVYGTGRAAVTTHDALNRPLTITEGGRITSYSYDLAGRAIRLISGNGQMSWNVYDELSRLKQRVLYANASSATILATFTWTHDAIGNVLTQAEEWPGSAQRAAGIRTTTNVYDDSNRLLTETVNDPATGITRTTYGYDHAHNRVSKTVTGGSEPGHWVYGYNAANQLHGWTKYTAVNGAVIKSAILVYDANGNRQTQTVTEGPNQAATTYQWDSQNRLSAVTQPDTTRWSYLYDYRTRRYGILRSGGAQASQVITPSAPNDASFNFGIRVKLSS